MNTALTDKKPRLTTSAMIASIASEGQRVKAAPFGKALVEYAASRPGQVPRVLDEIEGCRFELGKAKLLRDGADVLVISSGLGEAVASALLRHRAQPAGFQLAGLPDAFLDSGALPTLHDRYGISRQALGTRIKGWLG